MSRSPARIFASKAKQRAKAAVRKVMPARKPGPLRPPATPAAVDAEKAAYEDVAALGHDSPNIWIQRSASIGGWLFPGEHEFLWDLATRSSEGSILEIGTWMGKSACILAGACAETAPHTRVLLSTRSI